ncbi:MAG: AraC family transcriptional regulator [Ruminococcaceae bacterium]|nr:AraC family transcriptional regulator [Oscillospiraceae bacterium]
MKVKIIYRERGRDPYTDVPHAHESEFELIHVLSGKGKVFIGERVLPFCGDTVLLLDAAVLHYVSPDADMPYVRTKLLIDKSLTGGMVAPLLEAGYVYRVPSPELSAKADRALAALNRMALQDASLLEMMSHVLELLHLCTAQMQEKKSEEGGTVAEVVGYIHEHLETGVTLSDVAVALHINKHYLCRLFKGETGLTVGEYINSARIVRAKQLLRDGKEPIAFVASECGYNEPSVFAKSFKKETGMTPSAYRNLTRS